ncbi:MAG: polysaccharide deacetylase family protein [Bacillota bacterium]|jgi:peptidoglycan/xylan/chitin deacetylase (PgdA/CDA1 family)
MKKGIFIVVAAVIIIFVAGSLNSPSAKIDKKEIMTSAEAIVSGYENKSFVEDTEQYLIGVHIPQGENKKLNQLLEDFATVSINEFKQDVKAYGENNEVKRRDIFALHIDYHMFALGDELVSVVFDRKTVLGKEWQKNLFSVNYDLVTNNELVLNQLFKKTASNPVKQISGIAQQDMTALIDKQDDFDRAVFENGIAAQADNYDIFAMTEHGLVIYFDYGQLIDTDKGSYSLIINYDRLQDNLIFSDGLDRKKVIDPEKPIVAMTFDDGPHSKYTPQLLDALKKRDISVTFFVLGNLTKSMPNIVKRAVNEGHSVQIHSYNHIGSYNSMSEETIRSHIDKTSQAIMAAGGKRPTSMRPTYGAIDVETAAIIDMPIILWSVDTLDWKYRNAEKVKNEIVNKAKDGDIILLHDIYSSSVSGAIAAIDVLQKKGYQFVTVDELFAYKEKELKKGVIYTHAYP